MYNNPITNISKEDFINSNVYYVKRTKVKKPYYCINEFRMRFSNNGNLLLIESSEPNKNKDRILEKNSLPYKLKISWYNALITDYETNKAAYNHRQEWINEQKKQQEIRDAFYRNSQTSFNHIVELLKLYLNNPDKVKFTLVYQEAIAISLKKNKIKHSNYSRYYHEQREVIIGATDLSELILKKGKIGRKSVLYYYENSNWYYLHKRKYEFILVTDQNILRSLKLAKIKSNI